MIRVQKLCLVLLAVVLLFSACGVQNGYVKIKVDDKAISLVEGEQIQLQIDCSVELQGATAVWTSTSQCVSVSEDGLVVAKGVGSATVAVKLGAYTDSVDVTVVAKPIVEVNQKIKIKASKYEIPVGEKAEIELKLDESINVGADNVNYSVVCVSGVATLDGNAVVGVEQGEIAVSAQVGEFVSNTISVFVVAQPLEPSGDPYVNVDRDAFYDNYTQATSSIDAQYRSMHGLMSGAIDDQDQSPTVATRQPTDQDQLARNSAKKFSEDGKAYYVSDQNGCVVDVVYKDGAYVTLEDVAAYVMAFGDVPANYDSDKKAKPTSSIWGKYLRVNHSSFSGNVNKYPYEPILPDISGCGGNLRYYEIDIGTTGTDCDPSYPAKLYNNGMSITRGAARIVYARLKTDKTDTSLDERYVFYTYNHYNDFQEYLNYQGGWGEMFGNVTGGGTLSSTSDYNPTKYPTVALLNFDLLW